MLVPLRIRCCNGKIYPEAAHNFENNTRNNGLVPLLEVQGFHFVEHMGGPGQGTVQKTLALAPRAMLIVSLAGLQVRDVGCLGVSH